MNNAGIKAGFGILALALVMGLVLFGGAGTLAYWQAWAYMGVFFAAEVLLTLYLMRTDRALLERRMRGGPTAEPELGQRIAMLLASIGFVAMLIVPALDHRFGWSHVPLVAEILGDVLTAIWFYICYLVFAVNAYSASTVETFEDQRVISTGPYAVVRHPMYAAGALLFIGSPLALGSYWGFCALLIAAPAILWRLFDEERVLIKTLPGYAEYLARVRWRLLPGVF
jgi:protein-S-isoprenylcysteine O-methyltransferase Ste14